MQLLYGLGESLKMLQEEGLDNVFARHHRLVEQPPRRRRLGHEACAQSPDLYSETVTAVVVPEGFDGTKVVVHAADKYGVAFASASARSPARCSASATSAASPTSWRLRHRTAEMVMADLDFPIGLAGVAAAQEYYRGTAAARRRSPEHDRRRREDLTIPTYDDVLPRTSG